MPHEMSYSMWRDRQMDRHGEANSRILKFSKCA
jgi:hypothetical protein